jgi:hypothetical protein
MEAARNAAGAHDISTWGDTPDWPACTGVTSQLASNPREQALGIARGRDRGRSWLQPLPKTQAPHTHASANTHQAAASPSPQPTPPHSPGCSLPTCRGNAAPPPPQRSLQSRRLRGTPGRHCASMVLRMRHSASLSTSCRDMDAQHAHMHASPHPHTRARERRRKGTALRAHPQAHTHAYTGFVRTWQYTVAGQGGGRHQRKDTHMFQLKNAARTRKRVGCAVGAL